MLFALAEIYRTCAERWFRITQILLVMFCLGSGGEMAEAKNFTVTLDRDAISVGENATLTLKFEGSGPDTLPVLPSIPNLTFGKPSFERRSQQVFSATSMEDMTVVEFQYPISASQPGVYVIPQVNTIIAGQHFASPPIRLKVLAAVAVKPKPETGNAFLKLIMPKDKAYIGEIVPVEIQLYVQIGRVPETPQLNEQGFVLGTTLHPDQSSATFNGVNYNLVSYKSYVVPAKVGKLDIGPATQVLQVPKSEGRDPFGRRFVAEWQPVTLESEPQSLQSLPLPSENVPTTFNGAVGTFSINATASPTNVAVGDPITIKLTISGSGAMQGITLPAQTNWQQFKLYPPTGDFQPANEMGTGGTKTFSLTAVPTSMDVREVPPFQFSFFDPERKNYRTITQPAIPLIVRPSAASLPVTSLSPEASEQNALTNQDIVHIKPRLGRVEPIGAPLVRQGWFLGLQALPVIALAGVFMQRKRRDHLASNPRLRRELLVRQILADGLQQVRGHANANQPAEFFAGVFHLLQEQIGERLNLPASAITEAIIEDRLRPLGMPEAQLGDLHELFQACNQARYARQRTNAELVLLIPRLETTLENLRKLPA